MHECIIGLLHKTDYSYLATLNDLNEHIKDNIDLKDIIDRYDMKGIVNVTVYSIQDYCSRKTTDLEKFKYCPICGKKIEFKKFLSSSIR